ncbi:hypothetical protein M409DRAFT_22271 [Zasmidium cellare ATCC 36951]|uniref:Uncharacterized protein n=1 Tax=Zasmidium cellare ATCC 36951 TaxID=1080233 RepID=A0A6A6CLF2_ZASCE|nr:uncharacterized protein M409DRAFT_22271 [Zasmidium cellare ATCC 36951]KAF2167463.1 hypothetical protein M409DRAFT_22271 [Zasmidium cellare ATCC 36951]
MTDLEGGGTESIKDLLSSNGGRNTSLFTSNQQRGVGELRRLEYSMIMPAAQLHRRRELRQREHLAVSDGRKAATMDPNTLSDQFNNLRITGPGLPHKTRDDIVHLEAVAAIKRTSCQEAAGRLVNGDVDRQSSQGETGAPKPSLIVCLPIAVDALVLEKANRAIRSFLHTQSHVAIQLGHDIFIQLDKASSKKGLTTAEAELYQRKKCASKATKKSRPAGVSWLAPGVAFPFLGSMRDATVSNIQGASSDDKSNTDSVPELSAREVVLGTTELLENILIHLPPNTILVCQRICRTFKNCYGSSKQLKLKTFEKVRKILPYRYPKYLVNNGRPRLPFAMNPNFFTLAPITVLRRPDTLVWRLQAPLGVEEMLFAMSSDEAPVLCLRFNDQRVDTSWLRPYIGSWTKQHLTDPAFALNVRLAFTETRSENSGKLLVKKSAIVSWDQTMSYIGYLLLMCSRVNEFLVNRLFTLPAYCADLWEYLLMDIEADTEEQPLINAMEESATFLSCTIVTQQFPRKLN